MCMLLGLEACFYLVVFKSKWLLKDQIQTIRLSGCWYFDVIHWIVHQIYSNVASKLMYFGIEHNSFLLNQNKGGPMHIKG
jgi:hypothetical protein